MSDASRLDLDAAFAVTLPTRPYPGLRPFRKDEWPIFFGRERMADAVVADIVDKHVLVVHGDSGSGKSSLVRAAVLPRLEQENARGGLQWRTCSTAPGDAPLWNLARDLAALTHSNAPDDLAIELRRTMNFGPEAPARVAELLGADSRDHVCLLIDQFEELFAHALQHGPDEASRLTGFCTALYRRPLPGLHVILTMRSEFLGACARFDDFALTVNATQYLLPRMQHDDLRRAIREPARLYDGDVTHALADRLIADAGGGQDQLPLIQHGLMLLHREHATAGGWRLGLEHYGAERGLKGLLSDHADSVMTAASLPDCERLVEDVFRNLTGVNPDGQASRRPRTVAQLAAATDASEDAVRHVVDAFRADGVSFLQPFGDRPIEADERIDISHEALIRCWGRIADPADGWLIREVRNGLVWRALLVQADSFDRDANNVLSPSTTDERETWLRRRTAAWAARYGGDWDRVQRLVRASAVARDRERDEAIRDREREEQGRLREQRLRLLTRGSGLLAVLLMLAIGAAVVAWQQRQAAVAALAEARSQQDLTNAARARAEALSADAQESARELRQVLDELRRAMSSSSPSQTTQKAVDQIDAVAKNLTTGYKAPAVALRPRIYVQITNERYRAGARAFAAALEAATTGPDAVDVPGIELVKSALPASAFRCFRQDECRGEAGRLVELANRLLASPPLELQDLSVRYGNSTSARPRHYEIWFTDAVVLRDAAKAH